MRTGLTRFGQIYTKGLEVLVGGLLTGMIVVGFAAVIARFFLGRWVSLYWAEEVVRYAFIWAVFLISPVVIRRGAHLELDLWVQRLSPRAQRAVGLLNTGVILAFLVILIAQGVVMVRVNLDQLSSALEIPMAWIYLAVPVGGLLMLGEYVGTVIRMWRGKTEAVPDAGRLALE
jgi:TRAP-type C4-dicarboxylate transport system permease small subunit